MLNQLKTIFLLGFLSLIFVVVGMMIGGRAGLMIALFIAFAMNVYAYWHSDKMVLRMYGAKRASEMEKNSRVITHYIQDVRKLAHRAGLPQPEIYVIDSPQPNAFATGRSPKHAAVAASMGLLQSLNRQEISGVMAHELAHIKNRDTLTMTIAAILASAISMLASFAFFSRGGRGGMLGGLALAFLAPMAAGLVKMAVSRTREYEADKLGAEICGKPLWLASALSKIDRMARRVTNSVSERNPASAHLFIINPLRNKNKADKLFSTHPNTENRIMRLEEMAGRSLSSEKALSHQDFSKDDSTLDTDMSERKGKGYGPWGNQEEKQAGPWG